MCRAGALVGKRKTPAQGVSAFLSYKEGGWSLAAVYSHTESPPHYHRRWWTLLPGSGWDRVFPHRSCHQLRSPGLRVLLVLMRMVLRIWHVKN